MLSFGRPTSLSPRARLLAAVAVAALVLVRVPSIAQPPGGDQGLYAYVGQRILAGDVPYLDAWDQKPPAIHATYALMWAAWPDGRVVAATDLVVSVAIAGLLFLLARRLTGSSGAGVTVALVYLLLANPVHTRLGGARIRAQSELFIGFWIALAMLALQRAADEAEPTPRAASIHRWLTLGGGLCLGVAALYKYNAITALLPGVVVLLVGRLAVRDSRLPLRRLAAAYGPLVIGVVVPVLVMLGVFAGAGALGDLYHATITYNLVYSGETYRSAGDVLRYLVTFPVQYSWIDSLWWMGGLGCVILLVRSISTPRYLLVPAWVIAACISIAVNGSRGLPQVLRAGVAAAGARRGPGTGVGMAPPGPRAARGRCSSCVATGIWRVTTIPKAIDYTIHDYRGLTGQLSREAYLERFGRRESGDKFSALAIEELAAYLRANSTPDDRVLVFGFSPFALTLAERQSASRFFWSRPVIVSFLEGTPGYGVTGMLEDLARTRPRLVVLQRHDWDPDGPDSYSFFVNDPRLRAWLDAGYAPAGDVGNFAIWTAARMSGIPDTINGATVAIPQARRVTWRPARISRCSCWPSSWLRCCAARSRVPIPRGKHRSASSGTTRGRGRTTRATRRCGGRGPSSATTGTRCTWRRSSPRSSTPRSRPSVWGCGRRAWCRCSQGSSPSWRSARASRGSAGARRASSRRRCWRRTTSGSCTRARRSWKRPWSRSSSRGGGRSCARRRRIAPRGPSWPPRCAWAAYFTKASAVFFVAAMAMVCVIGLVESWWTDRGQRAQHDAAGRSAARALGAILGSRDGRILAITLVSLAGVGLAALLAFVVPNLADYVFYNWQMSVTRKPSYTIKAFVDRFSWFPVVHDIFTRMWFTFVVAPGGGTRHAGALARHASRRTPAAGVDRHRHRRTPRARRRERAAAGVPRPGADRPRRPWPSGAKAGCCRRRLPTAHAARLPGRFRSSSTRPTC